MIVLLLFIMLVFCFRAFFVSESFWKVKRQSHHWPSKGRHKNIEEHSGQKDLLAQLVGEAGDPSSEPKQILVALTRS
jgi:hypothetical protein